MCKYSRIIILPSSCHLVLHSIHILLYIYCIYSYCFASLFGPAYEYKVYLATVDPTTTTPEEVMPKRMLLHINYYLAIGSLVIYTLASKYVPINKMFEYASNPIYFGIYTYIAGMVIILKCCFIYKMSSICSIYAGFYSPGFYISYRIQGMYTTIHVVCVNVYIYIY